MQETKNTTPLKPLYHKYESIYSTLLTNLHIPNSGTLQGKTSRKKKYYNLPNKENPKRAESPTG